MRVIRATVQQVVTKESTLELEIPDDLAPEDIESYILDRAEELHTSEWHLDEVVQFVRACEELEVPRGADDWAI